MSKEEIKEQLTIGEYTILPFHEEDFWIEKANGEGMQIFKINMEKLIDDFFKSEF